MELHSSAIVIHGSSTRKTTLHLVKRKNTGTEKRCRWKVSQWNYKTNFKKWRKKTKEKKMHFRFQIVVNNDDQWIVINSKSNVLFQVPTRTLGLQSNLGRVHLLLPVPRLLDVCRGHLPLFKGLFFQSVYTEESV